MSKLLSLAVLLFTLSLEQVYSAGYAIKEQGASGQGNSFAGATAAAEDLSTIFFNPAGLTKFKGTQAQLVLNYISPNAKLTDAQATGAFGNTGGSIDGDVADNALTAAAYMMWDYKDNIKIGFGINSPWGLRTEYGQDSVARYEALESEVKTINFSPVVAWKINNQFSVGFGGQIQYLEAVLSQAADCAPFVFSAPYSNDCIVNNEGDAIDAGLLFGAIYEPYEGTRWGFNYRSQIRHELKGDNYSINPDPSLEAFFPTANNRVKADITTPETVNLGVSYDIGKFTLLADAQWTRWSRLENLELKFEKIVGLSNVSTNEYNWEDAWFGAIGATYRHDDEWTFRTGLAYDESPIPDEYRTPRVPDADRTWVSFGVKYEPEDSGFGFDLGYSHVFMDDSTVNLGRDNPLDTDLTARYENSVDIVSLQAIYKF